MAVRGIPMPGLAAVMGGPRASGPLSQRIFNKYDADGNGTLDKDEFKNLCYDKGCFLKPNEVDMAMKIIDKDGNGKISYDEFQVWWNSDSRFEKLQLSDDEALVLHNASLIFQKYDKDRTGVLERNDFAGLYEDLKTAGTMRGNLTLDMALEDLDSDRNGVISFNEYIDWLNRKDLLKTKVMFN